MLRTFGLVQQGDDEVGGRDAGRARFVGAESTRARFEQYGWAEVRTVHFGLSLARREMVGARRRDWSQRGREVRRVLHQHEARPTVEFVAAIYASAFTGQPVRRGDRDASSPFTARMDGRPYDRMAKVTA